MSNFLIFAGTSEGRKMAEFLHECGAFVCASVTTEYGKSLLPADIKVFSDRLEADEMVKLLHALSFDCVIDATHPYAAIATDNIKAACAYTETRYIRLLRPSGSMEGCVFTENAKNAANVLAATTGKVLLTTGSKELEIFTGLPDFQLRLYPRVLPTLDSINHCLSLGYQVQNIIAMQGPFTRDLNCAMMRQIGASILVTKESGTNGGFAEKLLATQDVGATAVVIGRPKEEIGLSFDEAKDLLLREYGLSRPTIQKKPTVVFPVFVNIEKKKIVVFGGGAIAARRTEALLPFCERVMVVSPQFDASFDKLDVIRVVRTYIKGDCAGCDLIFAATNNRDVNHAIFEEAKKEKIPINVADAPEECSFYFPGIARHGSIVAGITASGTNHKLAKSVTHAVQEKLEELISEEPNKETCVNDKS